MRRIVFATACLLAAQIGTAQAMPLVPPYVAKWAQAPDMDQGGEVLSMHRSFGPVVADDFRSDGRTITGFHWWGTYLDVPGTTTDFATGQGAERTVSFEISFHENCPANDATCNNGGPYSHATPSDGSYFSRVVDVEEDFFGRTTGGTDVYEYWVDVTGITGPTFLGGTWDEVAGDIYWLDVAWAAGQFGTSPSDDVWGWRESSQHNLGSAVTTRPNGPSNPHIGPWDLLRGRDMAFEVLTRAPEPSVVALMAIGLVGVGFARRRRSGQPSNGTAS